MCCNKTVHCGRAHSRTKRGLSIGLGNLHAKEMHPSVHSTVVEFDFNEINWISDDFFKKSFSLKICTIWGSDFELREVIRFSCSATLCGLDHRRT